MKHTEENKIAISKCTKEWWFQIRQDPKRLEALKIKMSKNNARYFLGKKGNKNPSWKGGIIRSKRDGYVLVLAPENHPYGKKGGGGNKRKYILEHRLVMEKVLGRYLLPDEDVNHINGIKDDNRPENLTIVRHYAHFKEMKCPKCEFIFRTR